MEPSKLESLPNEILWNLFANYINGVDLILGFNQLNGRFTSLISQIQGMAFDFSECRKDDFDKCLSRFTIYARKVKSIILSDRIAPGQINHFLLLYPVFRFFPQLRLLSLYFDGDQVDQTMVEGAIRSLIHTEIESLFLIGKRGFQLRDIESCMNFICRLPSLKRLHLDLITDGFQWNTFGQKLSNLNMLNVFDAQGSLDTFEDICRYAQQAKHLHVQLSSIVYSTYTVSDRIVSARIPCMTHLRTLNLLMGEFRFLSFERLATSLQSMPMLQQLTIEACRNLTDANQWEHLIATSLPLLTKFTLWVRQTCLDSSLQQKLLDSFQKKFWIEHRNFYFIIVLHSWVMDFKDQEANGSRDPHIFNRPVKHCQISPSRHTATDVSIIETFPFLDVNVLHDVQLSSYRFTNVRSLVIDTNDVSVFDGLSQRIDCSSINRLIIRRCSTSENHLTKLFQSMNNLRSLHTNRKIILSLTESCPSIIHLDIGFQEDSFDVDVAAHIQRFFPSLKHLRIRTDDITCVSEMKIYLKSLHCLEFDERSRIPDKYSANHWFNSVEMDRIQAYPRRDHGSHLTNFWLNQINMLYLFKNDYAD